MNTQIDTKGIKVLSLDDLYLRQSGEEFANSSVLNFDKEKAQMRDQIEMLEREIDRQSTIIDALIKAIKVIERG